MEPVFNGAALISLGVALREGRDFAARLFSL